MEEYFSWLRRKLSGDSAIIGGIIGFSRAGRLSVLLERWDPGAVLGGLKEWLLNGRVCWVHFGTGNEIRSDIAYMWFMIKMAWKPEKKRLLVMAKVAFWTPVSNEAPWEELWAIIKKTSWLVFLTLPSSRASYFMPLSNATSKVNSK